MKKGEAKGLLDHFNGVRPSIQLTLKVEKDGMLPFLDTLLWRKEDGSLDITVYRKLTRTDHYLDSHHPPHIIRGLVRCLYDRAQGITSTQDNLHRKEEHHFSNVLRWNGYPGGFICYATRPPQHEDAKDSLPDEGISLPLVMLPYTAGVSEDIRQVCRKYGIKVIFRSRLSLHSVLTRVKDPLPMEKWSKVVYQIPCSCSKI